MTNREYIVECRRCGRKFYAKHPNELYCNLPSTDPADKGRTCKQIRRIESKHKTREHEQEYKQKLRNGEILVTEMYGTVTSNEYLDHFYQYLRKKYNLQSYKEYQNWRENNTELIADEYEQFRIETGLHFLPV